MDNIPVIIALDVETTGLNPYSGDRIIEIALIKIKVASGEVLEKFSSLVNPERSIPSEASCINGIRDDMLHNAPLFKDIAAHISVFIKNEFLLIHKASFDISFLEEEFKRCGMTLPRIKGVIDTLSIARTKYNFPSNSLGNLAYHYEIDTKGLHRAEADAVTTYKIYCKFIENESRKKIKRKINLTKI